MDNALANFKKNRTRILTLAVLAFLFFTAVQGMDTQDWFITVMRGLSVGMITFLVAAGLSLILGLMDVLNLAHGELFMVGAYIGWTVFVRPDTIVDYLPLFLLLGAGFPLLSLWGVLLGKNRPTGRVAQIWPWVTLLLGLGLTVWLVQNYPVSMWNPANYAESPISFSLAMAQGRMGIPEATIAPFWMLLGLLVGSLLLSLSVVGFQLRSSTAVAPTEIRREGVIATAVMVILALLIYFANDPITTFLFEMPNTGRFFLAMAFAVLVGLVLGALIEITLIRPLYSRPIYQIMITLGLSFILIEFTRFVWGRPEFTMPKPDMFEGRGEGCPATNIGDLFAHNCAIIQINGARIRYYNEVFIIAVGLVVLVGVWLLLHKTRLGMIIRAGVQDSEMVEALGINVRQVFTAVFALGVGLASLGGVLAAPSLGLSNAMGTQVLLFALIALAIGGLTSFPGAAAGAILVGLMQQFMIKYGQIGINLPFFAEPFKPSPPLVPASTILLMVIILLILPNGLFGRNE